MTEKQRLHLERLRVLRPHTNIGKHWKLSEETKNKIRLANIGKKKSKSHCKNISIAKMGIVSEKLLEHLRRLHKTFNGDGNPNWRNGASFSPYPASFNKKLKQRIRDRDGNQCQGCGVPQSEWMQVLSIHHIDYNKSNMDDKNLITLCHRCNAKANFNTEYWKEFYGRKIVSISRI